MRLAERHRLAVACGVVVLVVLAVAAASLTSRGLPLLERSGDDGGHGGSAAPATAVGPSSALVRTDGDAATDPDAVAVVEVLTRHFTAINDGDFGAWRSTVTDVRASRQPEARWAEDFRTTTDSDVVVTDIGSATGGLVVTLGFVSVQDVAHAPDDLPATRICWSSRWPLTTSDGGGLRIGVPAGGTTRKRSC